MPAETIVSTTARVSATILLAIFVVATATMLNTVPPLYVLASNSSRLARSAIADACVAEIDRSGNGSLDQTIARLTRKYQLQSLRVHPGGTIEQDELRELRHSSRGVVEVSFRAAALSRQRGTVRVAAWAGAIALATAIGLLTVALSTLLRPASGRVEGPPRRHPRDESDHMIESFGASIQQLKGRESELRRLHEREKERADELATVTATLVRSLTSGFIALDESGRILDMNQEARQLLGITNEGFSGHSVTDVAGRTEFSKTLEDAGAGRLALQRREVNTAEGGVIGLTTVPLLDEHSHYSGMLALFTDLTPLRRLESRLQDIQSLADLGEMSAGIAHEFRNSLSTIVGYLKLARRGSLSAETDERLRRAEYEAQQLAKAVESLLVFARPMDLQRQRIDLCELAEATVERLRPLSGDVLFRIQGEPAGIQGDPLLLGRTIENLIRNAIDAIHEKESGAGTITIETSANPHAMIVIRDDGVGLNAADAKRLFLPFQSTKPRGFGVGLALAKKIVLLHGGTIMLTGEAGAGARVTIEFPDER
jgi:PAS domain S-box-containing protein